MRLTRDAVAGICLMIVAAAFAVSASRHSFGTLFRMGPGFYPFLVSVVLAFLGLSITIGGLVRRPPDLPEDAPSLELRTVSAVLGGVLVFALALERIGLVTSALLLILIAASAEERPKLARTVILAMCLAAIAAAIFIGGLGMNIRMFRWPF